MGERPRRAEREHHPALHRKAQTAAAYKLRDAVETARPIDERTDAEHAAHVARQEAAESGEQIREDRQAAALRTLAAAADAREAAEDELAVRTAAVRAAVVESRTAGVPVRRVAEVGRVAVASVTSWTKAAATQE